MPEAVQPSDSQLPAGAASQSAVVRRKPSPLVNSIGSISPHGAAVKSLTQLFGLDIRAAVLTILVDLLVFCGDTFSAEMLLPVGVFAAVVLAIVVYRIQIKWYGDNRDSALIKSLIIGVLTAVPVPITPILAVPGGIMGILNAMKRKWERRTSAAAKLG